MAFGDGNSFVGTSGFFPSVDELLAIGKAPFSFFTTIPAGAGYLFEVAFAGVSLAIVWGAMAERAKLYVYFVFGILFTLIYSITSHWIWSSGGWLFGKGMQDFAGSTVVHYQGALAALAGALLLGPRIGKFGHDGRANAIPGHNMPFAVLGTIILWFGWFGFNPGSTLAVTSGDKIGYFGYVALTTNLAAAAGALGGVLTAWIVIKKPDISMMLNGAIAALVAITAACGFVAPWAAIVIGLVSGAIAVVGVLFVERIGIDDPIGAVSVHGMAGVWGTLATGLFAVPALAKNLATGTGGLVYTGSFHQLGVQALGLVAVGAFTFSAQLRAPLGDEEAVGDPRRGGRRDLGPRRLGARHVGLPGVLHPGSRRLRHGGPRPPGRERRPQPDPGARPTLGAPRQGKAPEPERAAQDGALAAERSQPAEILHTGDPAGCEHRQARRGEHLLEQLQVGALERAVAADVRDEQSRHARLGAAAHELRRA